MTGRQDRLAGLGKTRDRAMVLPLLGFALLMPPVGDIFQLDLKIAGVPFTLVYLFAVWALLIACAWTLSRQLGRAQVADLTGGGVDATAGASAAASPGGTAGSPSGQSAGGSDA